MGFLKLNVSEEGEETDYKDKNLNSTNKKSSIPLLNMNFKWKKNWSGHPSLASAIHYLSNTLTLLEPMLVHACVSQVHPEEYNCLGLPPDCSSN